jgi:hypothetical protein
LKSADRRTTNLVSEFQSVGWRSLSKMPSDNDLACALNRNEAPRIALFFAVTTMLAGALFAANKTPNLISFNVFNLNAANSALKELFALRSD